MTRDLRGARVTFWAWEAGTPEPQPHVRRVEDARAVQAVFGTVSQQDSYVMIVEPRGKSRFQVSAHAEQDAATVEIAANRDKWERTTRAARSTVSPDGNAMGHGLDRALVQDVLSHYLFDTALPEGVTLEGPSGRKGLGSGFGLLAVLLGVLVGGLIWLSLASS